jgi:deazaflavin-dependent oxidoreductase (nitroreductase family)
MATRLPGFWKALTNAGVYKVMGRMHVPIYRATGGRIGHKTGPIYQLLLTSTGRKSGLSRTLPLTYMRDGENYVIVASHGGNDKHPAWWLNLQANPKASIQVANKTMAVIASQAIGPERDRLWPLLVEMNPQFGTYETITDRAIPVVVLTVSDAAAATI